MTLHVKKGDNVLVIAGKDKGKSGKVLETSPVNGTVIVAGINIIAKNKKPKKADDKGGIIKKEGKIDASNVQVICPSCNKATRISYAINGKDKNRVCKKCNANLDSKVTRKVEKSETKKSTTKDVKAIKDVKAVKETKSTRSTKAVKDTKTVSKRTDVKKPTTTAKRTMDK